MTHSVTPILGVDFTARDSVAVHALGTTVQGSDGKTWVYVKATEAVTGTCTVNASTFYLTDTAGNYTTPAAFASGAYGWVHVTALTG